MCTEDECEMVCPQAGLAVGLAFPMNAQVTEGFVLNRTAQASIWEAVKC